MRMIVEDWEVCPYREAWQRQKLLFENLISDKDSDEHLIMVEHPAVYTLGFHGNADNLLASEKLLRSLGAECVRIERGGDITYHGPGQLVIYPIVNLHRHRLGVKKYIQCLEKSVIELLETYDIAGSSNDDAIGVWLDWGTPRARKICAIGVKISHGITMHGLALNVNTDLDAFRLINPCGFVDKGVTSIRQELGRDIDMNEVKDRLSKLIVNNLG